MFRTLYYIFARYILFSFPAFKYHIRISTAKKELASEYLKKTAPCAVHVYILDMYVVCVCVCAPLVNNLHTFYSPIKMRCEKKLIQFRTSTLVQKEKLLKRRRTKDMEGLREIQWLRGKIVSAEIKRKNSTFVDCEILTHRCSHQLQSFSRTLFFLHTHAVLETLLLIWPITFIRICRFADTHRKTYIRKYL